MPDSQAQYQKVLKECEQLRQENYRLKQLLRKHHIQYEQQVDIPHQSKQEIIKERIKIFKNFFRGRSDVYALRWESKRDHSGYSPACEHEWHPTICKKPDIKCSACPHRRYLPLTDQVLFDHLSGRKTVGIYPILDDDTCYFLAVDFDKGSWKQDVQAFIETCGKHRIPFAAERSRSGNGCHIWVFFNEAIPASMARKMGALLLSKTLEKHYALGIDSYDRLFPNQDKLPKGGFGNLIALPLQGKSRKQGNSVFLDHDLEPIDDQWGYLSSIPKMGRQEINHFINSAGEVKTPEKHSTTLPEELIIKLKNGIVISKEHIPSYLSQKLIELTAFNNPAFYKAQANRLSTNPIPRLINCSDQTDMELILPRGCLEDVLKLCKEHKIKPIIQDETFKEQVLNKEFKGSLYPQQQEAVEQLSSHSCGVLSATTGFGKTVVGSAMIQRRQTNTLIIVHRKQLLEQWKESLAAFLDCEKKDIGIIGGGKHKPSGKIDVATIQTLTSKTENLMKIKEYGHIIVDECHHISAFTFERVMKEAQAQYVLGLTATPTRKDGLHPIMNMQCGPIRYKVKAKSQAKVHHFDHILIPKHTVFHSKKETIQELFSQLQEDEKRNEMIFNDILKSLDEGRSPIILTERQRHIDLLTERLEGSAKNIIVLKGGLSKKEEQKRLRRLKEIPETEERIIIATGKYIGEGFDDSRLDTLFLTMPVSWKGTLQQYVGRLHRTHHLKQDVKVYDYVDRKVPVLKKMYEKRLKGYNSLGYNVQHEKVDSEQMQLF
ncbi:DEAD/DEAH box helicase family protein [Rossellomorea oryzaecorticis]|uniref:DEAD/DEAH box helicase family protein n=1 Tax=Rossellomorea oryzaecorticis TaxID=1396505 RepID=A0ABU9K4L9_9BACI